MRISKITALFLSMSLLVLLCGCGDYNEFKVSKVKAAEIKLSQERKPVSSAKEITQYKSAGERLSYMKRIGESAGTILYFDENTGDIALLKGEQIYISTPWDLFSDVKSTAAQKDAAASQIHISYLDSQQSIKEINSFSQCIANGQYTLQDFKNGIQINMTIGREETRILLPAALPAESFENLIESIDGRALTRIKTFYKLYHPKESSQAQIDIIKEKYPVVTEKAIYVLKDITEKESAELEGYFEKSGYTFEQMEKDLEEVGAEGRETTNPCFKLSVRYELSNGELVVTIPSESIKFDNKSFSLLEVGVLEYFASAHALTDGYLFLPDGSGAIISFNKDGTKLGNEIKMPVYGYDRSLTYTAGYENLLPAALPVFGIKSENGTMIGIIESGDPVANITGTSGMNITGYARAGVSFGYSAYDSFEYKDVNTQYTWSLADKNTFDGVYSLRFALLEKEDGYAEMAGYYRDKLNLGNKGKSDELSLIIGLYGSVEHQENLLFMPVNRQVPLTTFEDAQVIADELANEGIDSLDLKYMGWSSGGLCEKAYDNAKVSSVLGGKSGLKKLNEALKKSGTGFYMDADLQYVTDNTLMDGFSASGDTARMLDKTYAGYNQVKLSAGLMNADKFKYALRPSVMLSFYEKFIKSYDKLGMDGLSLSTVGSNLNGDKDTKRGASRDKSLSYMTEMLKRASDGRKLIVNGGNRYTYEYADKITGLPQGASGYSDADYSVPFIQMVLHGSIPYTTPVMNLSGDFETEVLKAVENGAGLYFEFSYQNSHKLKNSAYADLYSTDFKTWKDKLISVYNEVNKVLGDLSKEKITAHSYIEKNLVRVGYSSGTAVYVNYNDYDIEVKGINIPAKGFIRTEEGE